MSEEEEEENREEEIITPIDEEQEEDLEEEAEAYPSQFDSDDFSQFIGERAGPSLEINDALEQIPDTLENTAETAPPTTPKTETAFTYTTDKPSNEPDYSGSGTYEHLREEEQKSRTMREHGILGGMGEADIHQRRAEQSQTGWGSELQGLQQQSSKYQQVMNTALEQETRRMPFERRKMKERRI